MAVTLVPHRQSPFIVLYEQDSIVLVAFVDEGFDVTIEELDLEELAFEDVGFEDVGFKDVGIIDVGFDEDDLEEPEFEEAGLEEEVGIGEVGFEALGVEEIGFDEADTPDFSPVAEAEKALELELELERMVVNPLVRLSTEPTGGPDAGVHNAESPALRVR